MTGFVVAASDSAIWSDLLEVIAYGLVAGVGVPIAFALAMRGLVMGNHLQREGRGAAATAQFLMGAIFSAVCIAAVGFALVSMFHR